MEHGGGEDKPLPHAVRVALRDVVEELGELEKLDLPLDPLGLLGRGHPRISAMNSRNSRPVSLSYRNGSSGT